VLNSDFRSIIRLGVFLVTFSTALGGCGGGASLPSRFVSNTAARQQVTFVIDAPKQTGTSNRRHPQYVSPATTQLAIDIQSGCPSACSSVAGYPTTVSLTPTTGGCQSTLADTTCRLTIALSPGSYLATLTTEDTNGTALSIAQSVPLTIVAGTNNVVNLTLSGLPVAIVSAILTHAPGAFIVNAVDADGNVIVGPGAPAFTVSQLSGVVTALTQPTAASPNLFFAAPANVGTATLSISASYGTGTNACTIAGAVCTGSLNIRSSQMFFAASGSSFVYEFGGSPNPLNVIHNGVGSVDQLATDAAGDLFVANVDLNTVTEYAPPYTGGPIATITNGVSAPDALAVDGSGNLFVADEFGSVLVFAPPYTGTPTAISNGVVWPTSLAVTSVGNLFVSSPNNNTVTEYAPPFTGAPIATLSVTLPGQLTMDRSDNLFMISNASSVVEYSPPYTGSPSASFSATLGASGIAVNSAGQIFVANGGNQTVIEYAANGSVLNTLHYSTGQPAIGAGDRLFIPSPASGSVVEFAPPYSAPLATFFGLSTPRAAVAPLASFYVDIAP
jgi:hypothetical protein